MRNKILAEEVMTVGNSGSHAESNHESNSHIIKSNEDVQPSSTEDGNEARDRNDAHVKAITRASVAEAEAENARRAAEKGGSVPIIAHFLAHYHAL